MKTIEHLGVLDLSIYQDDEGYCFTSDSILLSKFASSKRGDVVADFCAGSGVVGFYHYGLNSQNVDKLTLFEIQQSLYDLSVQSIERNGLEKKVNAVLTDVTNLDTKYHNFFSLVLCNPPYMEFNRGEGNQNKEKDICRREVTLNLSTLMASISKCLKFGGRVCMVHRADRLIDVVCAMRECKIEPKRLQMVSNGQKSPYLFLIEGVKGGGKGLTVLPDAKN